VVFVQADVTVKLAVAQCKQRNQYVHRGLEQADSLPKLELVKTHSARVYEKPRLKVGR
jgi:hypothetical protein